MKHFLCLLALVALLTSCTSDGNDSSADKSVMKLTGFDPNAGKPITDKEAKEWTAAFASKHKDDLRGYYFSAESYSKVLSTPGATGIRIVLGINGDGVEVMMLIPTDKSGNTIEDGTMYEFGQACPPYCDGGDTGVVNPTDSIK